MIDTMREQHPDFTVKELCEAAGVSASSYYASKTSSEGPRARENQLILKQIQQIHSHRHTGCYGSPRMTVELKAKGLSCSENRVARLMRDNGIRVTESAAFRPKTTTPEKGARVAPNLLKKADPPTGPGQVFVSDITYVATREGWLYLAVVIDLYSRLVAGWHLCDHMATGIVTTALMKASRRIPSVPGAIFHSDRGCQYTSAEMATALSRLGMVPSMSAKGYCYDNAKSESFFASIKREAFPDNCYFHSKAEARLAIFDYLETFYNRRRRHSSLEYLSPEEFLERNFQNQQAHLN